MREVNKRLLVFRTVLVSLFVIGLGIIAGGLWGRSNAERIDKEYISTTAKIESIEKQTKRRNSKNHTSYVATVSYLVNGKVYQEKLNAYSSSMQVGDSLELKYNPQRVTEIRSVEIENTIFTVMIIVGAIVLFSCLFMPPLFRRLKFIQ